MLSSSVSVRETRSLRISFREVPAIRKGLGFAEAVERLILTLAGQKIRLLLDD